MMLDVDSLTHRYGAETAVDDVSFGIERGELVALLGPSGCGKTTIVQAIAGHVSPAAGRICLRGEDVTDRPPEARQVGIVFQQPTLYPHMTVGENVAYGLRAQGIEPPRRNELVGEYLSLVSLETQREAYPVELSGGQRRRGELARALAPQPDVLLLDEPLSALDRSLRTRLRDEIARIQRETGVTTLYVTHDQSDAMALADRLLVMNEGQIAGRGRPRTLYESPPTPFVASFLGRSNAVSATVVDREPPTLALGEATITLPETGTDVPVGTTVTCHIRPEHLTLRSSGGEDRSLTATVDRVADVGSRYDVTVTLPGGEELVVEQRGDPPAAGERVGVEFSAARTVLFTGGERADHAPQV
jgi:ABC-type Fe3+/spermidine/putrescine transport system ATPase subunit